MRLTLILLMFCGVAHAAAPNIDVNPTERLTNPAQKAAQKEALKGLIMNDKVPAKADYVDEFHRGTVEFVPDKVTFIHPIAKETVTRYKVRNYMFHKVIVPDGTVLERMNFSQKDPHTVAIEGKNLHFKDCNLVNVEIDPTWTFEGGIRFHRRERTVVENGRTLIIREKEEKEGVWVEIDREDITPAE